MTKDKLREKLRNLLFPSVHVDHQNIRPDEITITKDGKDYYLNEIVKITQQAVVDEAVKKSADYLYSLPKDCPEELTKAIDTLRQLINEEFVIKDKNISSQLIYDL